MGESPVIEGEFRTGSELMLWRPGVDRDRLRWRAMWTCLFSAPGIYAVLGAAAAMYDVQRIGWWVICLGVLVVSASVLSIWVSYRCVDYDHQHGHDKPCFLDKVRGEYFYRRSDFHDLSPSMVHTAGRIVAAVRDVHVSPASAWLDPQQLRDIHRVAWDALRSLDRTRTLRGVIRDPRCAALSDDLSRAQSRLAEVDDALDNILSYLHQAVLLVRAWEQKLTEAEVRARLRAELDNVPHDMIAATLRRAELVPENIFAYITAARDLTNAGHFEWERAQP